MKKIAIIDRITYDGIYATYLKSENGGHHKAFIKVQEDLTFKVDNTNNIFFLKGDSVEIFIEPTNAIALTFSMFIMPLISFIIFYLLSGFIFTGPSEFFKILVGICGIGFSYLALHLYIKRHPQELPVVTKKLSQEDINAACTNGTSCSLCSGCN